MRQLDAPTEVVLKNKEGIDSINADIEEFPGSSQLPQPIETNKAIYKNSSK